MTETSIKIRIDDVKRLASWMERLDPRNSPVEIKVSTTPIGSVVTAYVETDEGEGVWKDITDYDKW